MAKHPIRPKRIAIFTLSAEADLDLSAIYTYTVRIWNLEQAENYAQFLKKTMQELADNPDTGRPIAERPGLRSYIATWKRAKNGHRIVYEEIPDGIYILRILHTSMNMADHI